MYLKTFSRETRIRNQFGEVYVKKSRKFNLKSSIFGEKKFTPLIDYWGKVLNGGYESVPENSIRIGGFWGLNRGRSL